MMGRGGFGGMSGFGQGFGGMGGMAQGGMIGFSPDDDAMRKFSEEEVKAQRRTEELAERFRRAAGGEKERIGKELTETVTRHFDIRQERREHELKRLREQLERLEKSVRSRSTARNTIIERRVGELIGDSDVGF